MTASVSAPASCKVYTDHELANAMVQRIGDDGVAHWLEPSVGPGVFVEALAVLNVQSTRITAFDIDTNVCIQRDLANVREGEDFIRWSLNATERFGRIIGNPPYIALSKLPKELKEAAMLVRTLRNRSIRGKVNYWYVFVCAMIRVLQEGGSLGLILPASWDYADYCADLREYLPSLFRHFEVHRCERPLFDGVGEGAVVLIAKGYKETPERDQRYEYPDFPALVAGLNSEAIPDVHVAGHNYVLPVATATTCKLSDVAEILIGGVTGDVKYFLFTDERREVSGLPSDCFQPILSRARHILASEATLEHWSELREAGERVWLFRPPARRVDDQSVQNYLNLTPEDGGCVRDAFKVEARATWYEVQLPDCIDGFISGMSGGGPFICMNSMEGLTASNTLYIVRFRDEAIRQQRYAWALAMLSSISHVSILRLLRRYADGLTKHEPKDLLQIDLPRPRLDIDLRQIYHQAVCLHLHGDHAAARRLADEHMEFATNEVADQT